MKESEALAILAQLQRAFWRHEVPEEAVSLYVERLIEFEFGDAIRATDVLIERQSLGFDHERFPLVGKLVSAILDVRRDRRAAEASARRLALGEGDPVPIPPEVLERWKRLRNNEGSEQEGEPE